MTKITAKARAVILASALLPAAVLARAAKAPPPPSGRVAEYEAAERLFLSAGPLQPLADLTERWQYAERGLYRAMTLGSYWRAERHLKLGAFYRLQYGARHDDDWINTLPGRWSWRDAFNRPESLVVLDATPRVELGGSFVGSLKVRYERNFFDAENVLRVAPELAWFWLDGLTPRATVFLRHEEAFALNFGESRVWQRWYYLAGLWHATRYFSVGPSLSLRDEVWSTSAGFKSQAPASAGYQTLFRAWSAGLEAVVHL